MVKAIFFDIYGTVAGFSPSRYEIQSEVCARFGIEVTPSGIIAGYALADEYMTQQNATLPVRLRNLADKEKFFAEYERTILNRAGIPVTTDQALLIWRAIRETKYRLALFEDVIPTLENLTDLGLVTGIITNIDRDGNELVDSLGLSDHLDVIVTSREVGYEKPSPRIFLEALKRAAVIAQDAIHVGDQPESDVNGAISVGITPVLIDRDGNHPDFDLCNRVTTLSGVRSLLGNIWTEFE